jgi:hypothetical protein
MAAWIGALVLTSRCLAQVLTLRRCLVVTVLDAERTKPGAGLFVVSMKASCTGRKSGILKSESRPRSLIRAWSL